LSYFYFSELKLCWSVGNEENRDYWVNRYFVAGFSILIAQVLNIAGLKSASLSWKQAG